MKNKLSILFILILIPFIVACGSNDKSNTSGGDDDVVELRFMYWADTIGDKTIQKMVDKFNEENPGIRVITENVPDEYETRLVTLMGAGNLPDIGFVPEGLVLDWGIDGHLLELSEYEDEFPELAEQIPGTYLYFDEGKHVGNHTALEPINIYYDKDIFDEHGVDYPPTNSADAWTWDEFLETAQKLTIDRNGNNALSPDFDPKNIEMYGINNTTYWAYWYPFVRNNGGDIADEEGLTYTLNSPESVDALQKLQDLIHKYHVAPTPTQQADMPESSEGLGTNRFAMVFDGYWSLNGYIDENIDVNLGVGVLPAMKEGAKTVSSSGATSIFATTEHPEEAIKFLLYHNNPEQSNMAADGVWMPIQEEYLTDEDKIDTWVNDEVHPPETKEAIIDYTLEGIYQNPGITLKNHKKMTKEMNGFMDQLWLGEGTAQELMDELEQYITPLLDGRYPKREE